MAKARLRAIVKMSLRKSPDKDSPLWDEWFEWEAGTSFTPPAHLNVERALARRIAQIAPVRKVTDGKA